MNYFLVDLNFPDNGINFSNYKLLFSPHKFDFLPHVTVCVSDFFLRARPPLKMEKYFMCLFYISDHLELNYFFLKNKIINSYRRPALLTTGRGRKWLIQMFKCL